MQMSPLAAVIRGAVASARGTLVIDTAPFVRYRVQGGHRRPGRRRVSEQTHLWQGAGFESGVWVASDVTLAIAGLSKPRWRYGVSDLASDLLADIAFGAMSHCTFRFLAGHAPPPGSSMR